MVRVRRTTPVVLLVTAGLVAVVGAGLLGGLVKMGAARAAVPSVGADVPVTAMDQLVSPSNNSPAIVADPTEPRFVVIANRIDAPDFSCALQVSGDGGTTWLTADPVPELPAGADKCYGPEVAFDRKGVLHYLFVGLEGTGNQPMGAFLTTSADRGRTFTAPHRVLGPLNFGVRMAIDPSVGQHGRVHLVWLHSSTDPGLGSFNPGPNPILAAHSDDGGRTFSTPVQVSDPDRARVVGPSLVVGRDHAVHVAYYDLQEDARDYQGLEGPVWEGNWSVVVASSLDGGGRFGAGSVVDDEIRPPERPILIFTMPPPGLVADGRRLCAAWTDARHGDPDAMVRCSPDGGGRWSSLQRLNDDAAGNGTHQYLPRLSLAPGGRIDAVFFDRRRDTTNTHNDVFYTFSTDGGRRFAANRRLTTEGSLITIGARYANVSAQGQYEIGGRLGLLSSRSSVTAAWPDMRHSLDGTGQDVFAATVRFPTASQPAWARLLGAAALAAGLVGAGTGLRRRRRRRSSPGAAPRADEGHAAALADQTGHPPATSGARRARPWLVAGGVVAMGVVVVRAGALGGPGPELPPRPQVLEVAVREYRFEYEAPALAGRTLFRVRNEGRQGHRFGLFPLPEDMPRIDLQLKGDERRAIDPLADLPQVRDELAPGKAMTFAVDLEPGRRYAFLCFVLTQEEELHADLGMNTEFRAGGKDAAPPKDVPPGTAGTTTTEPPSERPPRDATSTTGAAPS